MRILGIDPGLTRCGWGIIERDERRQLSLVDVGVIRTEPHEALASRLTYIADRFESLITAFEPESVAVEQVFAQENVSTVMGVAQVVGLAMVAATRRHLTVASHTPSEVKAAVSGYGRADKAQVAAMVQRILRLETPPKPADAADALALAITHAFRPVATTATESMTIAQRQWMNASSTASRQRTWKSGR